jgi:hypothetical protein
MKAMNYQSEEKRDIELDLLFGIERKAKGQKEGKAGKDCKGSLSRALQAILGGGERANLYISCVNELTRGQAGGLWETAAKKGQGEEALSFSLFVTGNKVSTSVYTT